MRTDHLHHNPDTQVARLVLHDGEFMDSINFSRIIQQRQPHEMCNLVLRYMFS